MGFLDDRHETYGTFVDEPQEIGLKYWLGGGANKIIKKTWYAHLSKQPHHYQTGIYSREFKADRNAAIQVIHNTLFRSNHKFNYKVNQQVNQKEYEAEFKKHQALSRSGAEQKFKGGLAGTGEMRITDGKTLQLKPNVVAYGPPMTEHDVVNTGLGPLRYLYVVAKPK